MADVNYLGYAQLEGARNPTADGLNALGDTIDQNRKLKMLEQEGARRNSLVDLQIKQHQMQVDEGQRQLADKESLRNSLSNMRPTVTDVANPAYIAALDQGPQQTLPPETIQKVTPPDPMQALFDYGMKTGDYDPATKALNVEAVLRKRSAQARAYGDIATSDKLDAEIEKGTKIATLVKNLSAADKTGELLRQTITSLPDVFKGVNPDTIKVANGISEFSGNGYTMVVGPDGKSHIVKEAADTKGFDTIDLGDRIKTVPRDGSPPTYEKKKVPPAVEVKIAADDRKEKAKSGAGKPLPPGALKMQQEAVDAIGTASGIKADLGAVKDMITSGSLELGPISNAVGGGLNAIGMSTESSRNLATFKATLEKLRNDSLRLNKGVQTDGDAQRAWNELMKNINDPKVVLQRLGEIENINERGITLQQANIDNIRSNYGKEPLDTTVQTSVKPAIGKQGTRPPLSAIFGAKKR